MYINQREVNTAVLSLFNIFGESDDEDFEGF